MLPQIDLPISVLTVPSTGKKLNYRPFTVKEEKILLIAKETEDFDTMIIAIKQVINNCTFGKIKNFNTLTPFDFEFIFITLRKESISSNINAEKNCTNCEMPILININLNDIIIDKPHENKILKVENALIELSYPNIDVFKEDMQSEDIFKIFAKMIRTVTLNDNVHKASDSTIEELEDFILSLPTSILSECQIYLDDMPKVIYKGEQMCLHCNHVNDVYLEGIMNFFD
jgi:hypothetical protein